MFKLDPKLEQNAIYLMDSANVLNAIKDAKSISTKILLQTLGLSDRSLWIALRQLEKDELIVNRNNCWSACHV